MIDEELLEKTLAELYPDNIDGYLEKRDIFRTGVQWGYNHPYFNKGCPDRVWHYLTEDPTDLPEVNKICLIKFSDGTGGVSSMIYKEDFLPSATIGKVTNNGNLEEPPLDAPTIDSALTVDNSEEENKVWVTRYRDDIIAWSYYVMTKVNGNYI